MKLRPLMILTASVYLALGAALARPWTGSSLRLLGIDVRGIPVTDDGALWPLSFTRLFGAALLGAAMIVFSLARTAEAEAQRAIVIGLLWLNVMLSLMTSTPELALLAGSGSPDWFVPILFGYLAASFGYFLFSARGVAPPGARPGPYRTLGELRESWLSDIEEAAAQQERSRLARDLHDSVKQQLFGINVNAATAESRLPHDAAGAQAALAEVRRGTREASAELQAMLLQLQPVPLASVGLIEALRQQCEALQYRTGATVQTDLRPLLGEERLPPGAHQAVFRIAQEALGNIARHARAGHVHVRLGGPQLPSPWGLELEIEDDGQGFELGRAPSGMGLSNIRARARDIGAELDLRSAAGKGTRLSLRVPFGQERHDDVEALLKKALAAAAVALFGTLQQPVFGATIFHSLLPIAGVCAVWAFRFFRSARIAIEALAARQGEHAPDVLRLRRYDVQARWMVLVAACFWNPWHALQASLGWNVAVVPLFTAYLASLIGLVLVSGRLHRIFRQQHARLPSSEFREELTQSFYQWRLLAVLPIMPLLAQTPRGDRLVTILGLGVILAFAAYVYGWRLVLSLRREQGAQERSA